MTPLNLQEHLKCYMLDQPFNTNPLWKVVVVQIKHYCMDIILQTVRRDMHRLSKEYQCL